MDQQLLLQVLLIVVQLAIIAIGGYVISYLKSKIGTENLARYYTIISNIVRGVEQTFGGGNGSDKKAEAVQLIKKALGNKLTDEQINLLIESAVFEMNNLLKSSGVTE
ncbi:MAG: phage holin [Clostridiales bacterium]|nr:phage holin [Clostridiales bacterium]